MVCPGIPPRLATFPTAAWPDLTLSASLCGYDIVVTQIEKHRPLFYDGATSDIELKPIDPNHTNTIFYSDF